jgi:hypothetical protein
MAIPSDNSSKFFPDFVNPDQLAQRLGISKRTLARWHARRIGPPRCTIGKTILYRIASIQEWLSANESKLGDGRAFRTPERV